MNSKKKVDTLDIFEDGYDKDLHTWANKQYEEFILTDIPLKTYNYLYK